MPTSAETSHHIAEKGFFCDGTKLDLSATCDAATYSIIFLYGLASCALHINRSDNKARSHCIVNGDETNGFQEGGLDQYFETNGSANEAFAICTRSIPDRKEQ